ncbi:hypothetical protein CN378_04740 [Bacillus sp. AFS015802]|nr:hypothetical protein CN378_04740 [Bacillus sp. AFS015802]
MELRCRLLEVYAQDSLINNKVKAKGEMFMWWEYYGDAVIAVSVLTAILILTFIHFFRAKRKKGFIAPLLISIIGYISFVIGIVFIRGWGGMGFIVYGVIIMGIGLIYYLGFGVYKKIRYQ